MTKDERRELLESVIEVGRKTTTDWNSQTLGKAFQSFLIAKLLKDGQIDEAIESSESCLARFVRKYDNGHFENDINEEVAGKLAEAIKSANKSSEPILKTPSP